MIKTLRKLGIEGNFLNLIKSKYKNLTGNIIFNVAKLSTFPPKIRNKPRMELSSLLFNIILEVLGSAIVQ